MLVEAFQTGALEAPHRSNGRGVAGIEQAEQGAYRSGHDEGIPQRALIEQHPRSNFIRLLDEAQHADGGITLAGCRQNIAQLGIGLVRLDAQKINRTAIGIRQLCGAAQRGRHDLLVAQIMIGRQQDHRCLRISFEDS